jgi:two-component system response regulator DevR
MVPLNGRSDVPTKVFILCCNRLLRESIGRILTKKTGFEVAAVQGLSSVPLNNIEQPGSHVLVLDTLEAVVGNHWSERGRTDFASLFKCVLVAMEDDRNQFLTAVRHGVCGYVLQDASAADVVAAIRAVAEGQAVCPAHYTRLLFAQIALRAGEFPNSRSHRLWRLTRREQQLIPLIGRGLSNKEIASHFGLSEQTVKNHIHRIMRKVGVSTRIGVYEAWHHRAVSSGTTGTEYFA